MNDSQETTRATGAVLAGASLAVLGIGCGEASSPQPPRDSFVELKPDHSRLFNQADPKDGMHPIPEPAEGWNPQSSAAAHHLHELVDGNRCKPQAGKKPLQEKLVQAGNLLVLLQQKEADPKCANSFYTRVETVTDEGVNGADYTVDHRVIPADPTQNPYRLSQESIPGSPELQAYTVMTALKLGDRVISCIISGGDEACINPYTVGQPPVNR